DEFTVDVYPALEVKSTQSRNKEPKQQKENIESHKQRDLFVVVSSEIVLQTWFKARGLVNFASALARTGGDRSAPSPSHQPHSASASQTSALHNLLLSRTSSVHMRPFDADISHNSATIEPSSLVKVTPTLLPPMTSTQTTMANATSSSLSVLPPLHPPLASYQPQSVPLPHHPFPLPMVSPSPPYGMPFTSTIPATKTVTMLTPAASYVSVLTRDQVKDALLRLVQNDNFIDMVYREMAKRPCVFLQIFDRHGGVEGSSDGERALVDDDVRGVHVMDLTHLGIADPNAEEGSRHFLRVEAKILRRHELGTQRDVSFPKHALGHRLCVGVHRLVVDGGRVRPELLLHEVNDCNAAAHSGLPFYHLQINQGTRN
ncbi:hypothetical protein EJB05_03392, partial [Eragrostis curvula]